MVDALGKPVAGAEVCAGASSPLAPVGILQPTQVTAEDGTFEVVGISELGTPMASARRSARESGSRRRSPAPRAASRWS